MARFDVSVVGIKILDETVYSVKFKDCEDSIQVDILDIHFVFEKFQKLALQWREVIDALFPFKNCSTEMSAFVKPWNSLRVIVDT